MPRPQWLPSRDDVRGLLLALAVAAAAIALTRVPPRTPYLSEILVAIVLGAVVLNTPLRRLIGLALPGPDREPDRYAAGLRWVGKWGLRLAIILLGLKVRTEFFRTAELALIAGDALAVGARIEVEAEGDDRPGHGGEGAAAGRWSA